MAQGKGARLSINKAGEFTAVSTPTQRRNIIDSVLSSGPRGQSWSTVVKPVIRQFLLDSEHDNSVLYAKEEELLDIADQTHEARRYVPRNKRASLDRQIDKVEWCAEMIRNFIELYANGVLEGCRLFPGSRSPGIELKGTRIVANFDLRIVGLVDNEPCLGALVFRFDRVMEKQLRRQAAHYSAAIIKRMLVGQSDLLVKQIASELCLVVDVPDKNIVSAPQDLSNAIATVEEACAMASALWPKTVKP